MSKNKHLPQIKGHIRPGEGFALRMQQRISDAAGISVAVDLSSAPVPDKKYVADVGTILERDHAALMVFGQNPLIGGGRPSLVSIKLGDWAIRQYVKSFDEILPSITGYAQRVNLRPADLITLNDSNVQFVSLIGNVIAVSFAGRDANMDFYYISPSVIHYLKSGGQFVVDPIVRIYLPTDLLWAVSEGLKAIAVKLGPQDGEL